MSGEGRAGVEVLERLAATVAARRGADPASSHTAKLLAKGPEKCAEKFGEEAIEAIVEAVRGDRDRLAAETADVLYHLLVMLAARDVPLGAVMAELARREGVSGLAEKASRGADAPPVYARVEGGEGVPADCLEVRRRVFVEEQGVAPELEVDGLDDGAVHYRASLGGETVATARVRFLDGAAKIQRVAVLPAVRGRRLGEGLMRFVLDDLAAGPAREAVLDSQTTAIAFYERLGFVAEGPEFLDAGIPHRRMRRPLG